MKGLIVGLFVGVSVVTVFSALFYLIDPLIGAVSCIILSFVVGGFIGGREGK